MGEESTPGKGWPSAGSESCPSEVTTKARIKVATTVKPGLLISVRSPYRKSLYKLSIEEDSRGWLVGKRLKRPRSVHTYGYAAAGVPNC